jgi:diguanylate cyclase (GGDEF)-like protein
MRSQILLVRVWGRLARNLSRLSIRAHSLGARVNARLTKGIGSPRAFIGQLGLIITCVTVFVPPLTYATLSTLQLKERAESQASLGARHVAVQLNHQSSIDWLSQVSINVLHATRGPNGIVTASWLTDKTGRTVMFKGEPAWWPEFTASKPIEAANFEGSFHVAVTTRGIFIGTLNVAAAFLVLGLAVYYCFRRLPLAALDKADRLLYAKQAELRAQKEELETQNLRFEAALSNMSQGLCMFDGSQRLVVCNTRYTEMYRLSPELAVPGTTLAQILEHRIANGVLGSEIPHGYVDDSLAVAASNAPSTRIVELNDRRAIAIAHRPMPGGGWLSTHDDLTEYRRIEARVAHMARHDALTELPNRVLLLERLEAALEDARAGKGVAVLCLDLDRFKHVNDTFGHNVGDALIKAVGERLGVCIGDGNTVARLGGDEYSIVQIGAEQPLAAMALAARIIEVVGEPIEFSGQQVKVGTSIGIAVAPADGTNPDQLLKNADLALNRAKGEGRGIYRFFEAGMDAQMRDRFKLQIDLQAALANGEFELHYQPLVNLERNEISCLEALLRWHHPERGRVSPGEFIPLAEETGLIVPIGEWALREACAAAASWPAHVNIAINISAIQFKSRNLTQAVFSALAASGLSPARLELEITESVLLQNDDTTLATLHQLRALGVRIALDDFGTGYSSLSYLRSFPFDKIKIDRCFVADLSDADEDALAILRAVAGLGISLGIATTAEGVETKEQLEKVREEGCTEMQGYLFSPPKPINEIARLFQQPETKVAGIA